MFKIVLLAIFISLFITSCSKTQENTWQNKNIANNNQEQWAAGDVEWYLAEWSGWQFLDNPSNTLSEGVSGDETSESSDNPFNF